jgi:hypothetical protein
VRKKGGTISKRSSSRRETDSRVSLMLNISSRHNRAEILHRVGGANCSALRANVRTLSPPPLPKKEWAVGCVECQRQQEQARQRCKSFARSIVRRIRSPKRALARNALPVCIPEEVQNFGAVMAGVGSPWQRSKTP